jgi:hypothetical protein
LPAFQYGAPGRIRTSDPQVRSLVLYPAELRALRQKIMTGKQYSVNVFCLSCRCDHAAPWA